MTGISPLLPNSYIQKAIQKNIKKQDISLNNTLNSQYVIPSFKRYESYLPNMTYMNQINFKGISQANYIDRNKELHFNDISTGLALTPDYRKTVQEAYDVLGKKNVALICHDKLSRRIKRSLR